MSVGGAHAMAPTAHRSTAQHLPAPWSAPETLRTVPLYYWCFLLALVLNVFSGSWEHLNLPVGPDRLLFPAAFVLLALHPGRARVRFRGVHGLMLLFGGIAAVSLLFLGTIDTASIFGIIDRVWMPFLLFAAAPLFLSTPVRRLFFLRAMTLLGLYLGVTSIAEMFQISPLVVPRYILEAHQALVSANTGEPPRAGGPMLASEGNGMANAMCAVLAALLATRSRGGWRVLAVVVVPICLIGAFLSMTRSVWLGAALGIVLVLVTHRPLWRWIPPLFVLGGLAAAIGAAAFPQLAETAVSRGSTSRSVYDRFNTNIAGLRIVEELPLTGIGWGEFLRTGTEWVRQSPTYPLTSVDIEIHNVFLSRAAELGLPAAALFVLIVVLGPVRSLFGRRSAAVVPWRAAFIAVFTVWLVPCFLSPNPYTFPNFLMWTLAGLVFALPRPDDESPVLLPPLEEARPVGDERPVGSRTVPDIR